MSSPEPAPRLLRAFLAVAEELHFTRAAARLYVAQQALSRDVRRLEAELGTELLVRSTRRAELTPDGERFVPYARRVLAAYEELGSAFGQARPLLVDVNSPGLVFERVLEHARRLVPELEVMARYESGLTGAALEIGAGRLDASFGRWAGLEPALRDQLDHQPLRLEPMAVVLPEDHPLAALAEVPLGALAGEYVYGRGQPPHPRVDRPRPRALRRAGHPRLAARAARRRPRGIRTCHGEIPASGARRGRLPAHAGVRAAPADRPRAAVPGLPGVAQGAAPSRAGRRTERGRHPRPCRTLARSAARFLAAGGRSSKHGSTVTPRKYF